MSRFLYCLRLPMSYLICLVLLGCTLQQVGPPVVGEGKAIEGAVHGGQQPIVGAHIYLLSANTAGYGGSGIAASNSNASISLLSSGAGTTLDTGGGTTNGDYYVTTGAGGTFSITGDYSCTPNTQIYLYALGGNPGLTLGTNNLASGLLAALGNCPSNGNFLAETPSIIINEATTIAAAYAFAGFATDATHVSSSGTALAQVGIQNAFANAANLVSTATGQPLLTTPAGNGAVPQTEINLLADVLAACVNTTGAITGPSNATTCYTLFTNALSGGSGGIQPADTANAAINIAHNPGANTTNLFNLAFAEGPFQPSNALFNDYTLAIRFTGGGLTYTHGIAIDAAGNAWVASFGNNSVSELSPTGAAISPSTGYTGGGPSDPINIAIDSAGNAWAADYKTNAVTELSSTGTALSPTAGFTGGGLSFPCGMAIDAYGNAWIPNCGKGVSELSNSGTAVSPATGFTGVGSNLEYPYAVAIDASGFVWVANEEGNSVTKLSSAGVVLSPSTGFPGGNSPHGIAIDASGDVWVANLNSGVAKLSSAGALLSPSSGFVGGGLNYGAAVTIDGAGNAWIANQSSVTEFSNAGAALSPSVGYDAYNLGSGFGIAVDGSGDIWVSNGSTSVSEIIGAGTPVVTPLAVGVKNNTLGVRP